MFHTTKLEYYSICVFGGFRSPDFKTEAIITGTYD